MYALLVVFLVAGTVSAGTPVLYYTYSNASLVISSSTTLTSNLVVGNLTVNSGVALTTDGYSIFANGSITNYGTILTGQSGNGGNINGGTGGSVTESYAGSGGGGGSGGCCQSGGNGGGTLASAGGGAPEREIGGAGGSGSSPSSPVVTNANILLWYTEGFSNIFTGAGGGGGANGGVGSHGGAGGSGEYGVYLQGQTVSNFGAINASGQGGSEMNFGDYGNGGGGGGGAIFISYLTSMTNGTITFAPGAGTGGIPGGGEGAGGQGGSGNLIIYQYNMSPILILPSTPQNVVLTSNLLAVNPGENTTLTVSWVGGAPPFSGILYANNSSDCSAAGSLIQNISGIANSSFAFDPVSPSMDTYYCASVTGSQGSETVNSTPVLITYIPVTTTTTTVSSTSTTLTTIPYQNRDYGGGGGGPSPTTTIYSTASSSTTTLVTTSLTTTTIEQVAKEIPKMPTNTVQIQKTMPVPSKPSNPGHHWLAATVVVIAGVIFFAVTVLISLKYERIRNRFLNTSEN